MWFYINVVALADDPISANTTIPSSQPKWPAAGAGLHCVDHETRHKYLDLAISASSPMATQPHVKTQDIAISFQNGDFHHLIQSK